VKTHKNLFHKITDFQNLLIAATNARKGKRMQPNVARFHVDLEPNLFALQRELTDGFYRPGNYRSFHILDPKPRMISAAPYRDRVVHHALCNLIAPILEGSMTNDTYANRKGMGSHAAMAKYRQYCRRYPYVLKCDVRKFFPSIDHEILKRDIRRKIGCRKTLALIEQIIDNSNPQEEHIVYFPGDDLFTPHQRRHGLPIGNLTSQLWGNFYLNRMDHFIKETLRCKAYVRYVDDFVLLSDDKAQLHAWKSAIESFLCDYRLILHPNKSRIHHTSEGITFLGYRVFPDFILLPSANVRRFRQRTKKKLRLLRDKKISLKEFFLGLRGWEGHALRADTRRLRRMLTWEIFGIWQDKKSKPPEHRKRL
jgi:hypothetical protein